MIFFWLLAAVVSYALLLCYCGWFDSLTRRHAYVLFVPMALIWPLTAVISLCWSLGLIYRKRFLA